jgi:hypothetical protein
LAARRDSVHLPGSTSLSTSLSSLTAKSRPCCEMLFWLFDAKSPPMTSALYPYAHTRASCISDAKYSSGQKDSVVGGAAGFSILLGVGLSLAFLKPKNDFMPLRRLGVLDAAPAGVSSCVPWGLVSMSPGDAQVSRGCPRRPWTKMMLARIRSLSWGRANASANENEGGVSSGKSNYFSRRSQLVPSLPASKVNPSRLILTMPRRF